MSSNKLLGCKNELVSFIFLVQTTNFHIRELTTSLQKGGVPTLSLKCAQAPFPQLLCKGLFRLPSCWQSGTREEP